MINTSIHYDSEYHNSVWWVRMKPSQSKKPWELHFAYLWTPPMLWLFLSHLITTLSGCKSSGHDVYMKLIYQDTFKRRLLFESFEIDGSCLDYFSTRENWHKNWLNKSSTSFLNKFFKLSKFLKYFFLSFLKIFFRFRFFKKIFFLFFPGQTGEESDEILLQMPFTLEPMSSNTFAFPPKPFRVLLRPFNIRLTIFH